MNLHDLGEFGLIARAGKRLSQRTSVRVGIGDDAAVLNALESPIATCDCLVETVHFRRDWTTPRLLGHKAIAVNVSDIAAMGGRPVAALITLALSPHDDLAFVDELYRGFEEAAALYDLTIAGGDTARSPSGLMLSITLLGNAPQPVLRSGARAGDLLLISGTLGDSAAGLALLQNGTASLPQSISEEAREYLLARHHDPQARLAEMHAALTVVLTVDAAPQAAEIEAAEAETGKDRTAGQTTVAIEQRAVTAALDLSDGLAGDAAHIAERSGLSLEIEAARIPISPQCRAAAHALEVDALDWALRGGEDYELLWCVAPAAATDVSAAVQRATGTSVTMVGRCIPREENSVSIIYPDGRRVAAPRASEHF